TDSTNTGLDTANPFIYRGYWYDWDTGLYYLNARYYNPRIGRFLSKDPVGPTFGDVESYNSFSYARSNPLTIADPAGKTVNLTNALLVVGTVVVIGGLVVTTGGLASVVGMAVSTSTADLVLGGIVVAGLGLAGYEFANNHGRIVNPPKSQSPIWQGLQNHKNGTKTSGSGKDKRYYQWDNTHNDIEVYDHKGKHIGSMDPTTGEMYKPPVPGRRIQPI
ncbi:MAG: hypothetical protein K6T81_18735, partial [Alicyclobacillus macrosporangiidus]|uniref:RHS repeat-associated core domain-containing protein n=1 Tax=Alicyclobacillus macrosporangiidus TaxID=392015 RepID=UPI0026F1396E